MVRRLRRSGQSIAAFAREHGLDPQRVRYWRERVEPKVERAKQRGPRATRRSRGGGKLVPGVVSVGVSAPVRVHLARGVVVEAQAARDMEPTWVAELVRVLERPR